MIPTAFNNSSTITVKPLMTDLHIQVQCRFTSTETLRAIGNGEDGHLSSHVAPELCDLSDERSFFCVLFWFSHNIFLPIHTHKGNV